MDWVKYTEQKDTYYTTEIFNGFTYKVFIYVENNWFKSIKYWVGATSGKKRKDLEIFEDKSNKSLGSIKGLLWIKKAMYDFPKFYAEKFDLEEENRYICIQWSDSRRREIYGRLIKEGFQFMQISGEKILMKKL